MPPQPRAQVPSAKGWDVSIGETLAAPSTLSPSVASAVEASSTTATSIKFPSASAGAAGTELGAGDGASTNGRYGAATTNGVGAYGTTSGYGTGYGVNATSRYGGLGTTGYGGGYGSSMYGSSSMYGGGYGYGSSFGGGHGMGMYGGGYNRYGMGAGLGVGSPGPMGEQYAWLHSVQHFTSSLGYLTELLGMNTQAIGFFLGNAMGFLEHVGNALAALQPWREFPMGHPRHGEPPPTAEEERKRVSRVRVLRWAVGLFLAYAAFRIVRGIHNRLNPRSAVPLLRQTAFEDVYRAGQRRSLPPLAPRPPAAGGFAAGEAWESL
ncbi:unnamed protein product [Phaeothamnion confervicola]